MFSQQRCAAVVSVSIQGCVPCRMGANEQGVTISTSAIVASGTGTGASPTSSSIASSTSVVVTGTPISWEQPPVLYQQTLVNIQAIVRPLSHLVHVLIDRCLPSVLLCLFLRLYWVLFLVGIGSRGKEDKLLRMFFSFTFRFGHHSLIRLSSHRASIPLHPSLSLDS